MTPYLQAQRFIGMEEIRGPRDNPMILAMLKLCTDYEDGLEKVRFDAWPQHDEVPWCSAFVNYIAWQWELPRSKSLMARSWLNVGCPIPLSDAQQGYDIVILSRGSNPKHGHVGFYSNHFDGEVHLLGGNQSDSVCIQSYTESRILGVRRLI